MSATILITGASGKLGSEVISSLLDQGVAPSSIAALVRSEEKGQAFKEKGVEVRVGDYGNVESLDKALDGIQRVLFVSSNDVQNRPAQHSAFVNALRKSSVKFVAYTSLLNSKTTPIRIGDDHKVTEQALIDTKIPHAFLRNGWYTENMTDQVGMWAKTGAIMGATGSGRVSSASRKDYAEAAARVMSASGPVQEIYELGGSPGYTLDELADTATKVIGKPIKAVHLSPEEYAATLTKFGLDAHFADLLADADANTVKGHLETSSQDLQKLIGRPSESVEEVLQASWKAAQSGQAVAHS